MNLMTDTAKPAQPPKSSSAKSFIDNAGEADYAAKIRAIAERLRSWSGPVVLISHTDPDGDALGSSLALKRALTSLGKTTTLPLDAPRFLRFLVTEAELSAPLETLPENCLLAVLDVEIGPRATGAPLDGAALTLNIDHHGSNPRTGDLSCVEPGKAATAQMVKDIIDALGVAWTPELATPCLTGIVSDTGNFRYSNTNESVLADAAELMAAGVDYAELTDRLQWRDPKYFVMLGKVMSTVTFAFDGRAVLAHVTPQMKAEVGELDDDSNDYVGLIRYAEGTKVAAFLKEGEGYTKLSVRTRDGVSAQNICHALGGGGHVNAAGAKLNVQLAQAREKVLAAIKAELDRVTANT